MKNLGKKLICGDEGGGQDWKKWFIKWCTKGAQRKGKKVEEKERRRKKKS